MPIDRLVDGHGPTVPVVILASETPDPFYRASVAPLGQARLLASSRRVTPGLEAESESRRRFGRMQVAGALVADQP